MRKDDFVMRGKTASGFTEVLNFSGRKPGYAYKLIDLELYPSIVSNQAYELCATITAGKTGVDPQAPDFSDEGLIAVAMQEDNVSSHEGIGTNKVINDTFLITQNLILFVIDTHAGSPMPVNWQCRFRPVKISGSEEAVANYRQFMISDD